RPPAALPPHPDRRVITTHLRAIPLTSRRQSGSSELHSPSPPMTTPAQPESRFLTVNGLRLHYLDWGKPGPPPILCIHGYTSSAEAFSGLARHFQDRFHLIITYVRGHGERACSATVYSLLDERLHTVAGLADQL